MLMLTVSEWDTITASNVKMRSNLQDSSIYRDMRVNRMHRMSVAILYTPFLSFSVDTASCCPVDSIISHEKGCGCHQGDYDHYPYHQGRQYLLFRIVPHLIHLS